MAVILSPLAIWLAARSDPFFQRDEAGAHRCRLTPRSRSRSSRSRMLGTLGPRHRRRPRPRREPRRVVGRRPLVRRDPDLGPARGRVLHELLLPRRRRLGVRLRRADPLPGRLHGHRLRDGLPVRADGVELRQAPRPDLGLRHPRPPVQLAAVRDRDRGRGHDRAAALHPAADPGHGPGRLRDVLRRDRAEDRVRDRLRRVRGLRAGQRAAGQRLGQRAQGLAGDPHDRVPGHLPAAEAVRQLRRTVHAAADGTPASG